MRATLFVVGVVSYVLIFGFGFWWSAMIMLLFSGSTSVFLLGGVVGGLLLCWFARGLMRNVVELIDRDDRTT